MPDESAIRAAFRQQAEWCRQMGSPFTALLMDAIANGLDRSTPAGAAVLDWTGEPGATATALPLRLAGGLHALVRRGRLPGLAALYPPHPSPDPGPLWREVSAALGHPELAAWLEHAPQTNEVARSAALMAGLMVVTAEAGLPVSLLELGASAGLNLLLDRYAFQLGGVVAGDPASPIRLEPRWQGPPPPDVAVRVAARRGVDLQPLDVRKPEDRERLVAYIWADQVERLARVRTAMDLAQADPPPLDRGDAAGWLEHHLVPTPEPGIARVVMHSIAFQYFPPATQERIRVHLERCGSAALPGAPLAWLRLEHDPARNGTPALSLTTWPEGRTRVLATGSAHGHWIEWL